MAPESNELVNLSLFGTPCGDHGKHGPLVFRERKSLALLATLAVVPGVPQSRERLATLLWPELSDVKARRNLRVALARLNRTLGEGRPPYVVSDRQQVCLDAAAGLVCDVRVFDSLVAGCEMHAHDDIARCSVCRQRLTSAAALYGGDFLDGFRLDGCEEFDEWQTALRERRRETMIDVLDTLAAGHEAFAELVLAERRCREAIALDPLDERGHRRLVRVLARQGQRSAALAHYRDVVELLHRELGVAPDARLEALHEAIVRGDLPSDPAVVPPPLDPRAPDGTSSSSRGPHDLPQDASPYIGNDDVLDDLVRHLGAQRLLTLGGIGGIGKTRLALQLARRVQDRFPDGCVFVRLAPLREPSAIVTALASALRVRAEPGRDVTELLLSHLAPRRALLVMDNFEHVLGGRGLIADILERAPSVSVLVTSRQKLGLRREALYPVRGLPTTSDDRSAIGEGTPSPAARLFLDVARRVRLDFVPRADDLAHVARIARRVAGHPLALSLAAGWLESLSCRQIAAELENGTGLLTTASPDVPERQRSVEATFEHSWALLDEAGRRALSALSVFRGGFDREAAEAVADASLHRLSRLVNRSLIERHPDSERYEMHELMRQFAADRLEERGERAGVASRHCRWYLSLLEALVTAPPTHPGAPALLPERLVRDGDNVRAAWLHGVHEADINALVRTLGPLRDLCTLTGREPDLIALLEPIRTLLDERAECHGQVESDTEERAFELELLLALGVAYRSARGFLDPVLGPLFDRARTLVGDAKSSPELFAVLYGIWSFSIVATNFERAFGIAADWRAKLDGDGRPDTANAFLEDAHFVVHCIDGPNLHLTGELTPAQATLERGLALDRPDRRAAIAAHYGLDFAVSGRYWLATNQCLLGQLDSALSTVAEAEDIARGSGRPLSLAFAALGGATVSLLRKDDRALSRYARDMQRIAIEHHVGAIPRHHGSFLECFATAGTAPEPAIARMLECLDAGTGALHLDLLACLLIEVLLQAGRVDEAASRTAGAAARADSDGLVRFLPEMVRLGGEVALAQGDRFAAASKFERSIALARSQGALLLELRATTSLARLRIRAGEGGKASARLREVVARFGEACGTPDLLEALVLLDTPGDAAAIDDVSVRTTS